MHDKLWWQKPMVILAHVYDINQEIERDPAALDKLVRWKRKAGFDVEHVLLNYSMFAGKGGEDSRAYLFKNFHGYHEDWLQVYLPIARRHGLRVIVYFNCHWFKFAAFPADYFVVDASGRPKVIYGDGGEICTRGPFRAWSEKMAEDLGRYPIDGVFLDGPVKDSCWCPHCRREFQAQYGEPLPDDPAKCPAALNQQVRDFLENGAVGYIQAFARGLRRHNPEAVLYCNGGDLRQMEDTADVTQLVGIEGGFIGYNALSGEFPFSAGSAAKSLESRARGRARVIFCDCGYKGYDYHVHPKGEIARMYAGTISNGANPWLLVWRSAAKSPGLQTLFRYNRLICDRRDALANGESLAEAAILKSQVNSVLAGTVQKDSGDDVHRRDAAIRRLAVPRHADEFNGCYAALTRSGYPFDVVQEDTILAGELPGRTRLLVLPGVGAVSDQLAEQLRVFVDRGGRLLATFDTSLFDEQGNRRPDFALAEVFGASLHGELHGPSRLDYFAVSSQNALTAGLSQVTLPCPEHWWLVKAGASAKTLLYYYGKMPRRYANLPPVSDNPAVLLNRFGKGEAIFIPSTIGQLALQFKFPDTRRMLINAARRLAPPPVTLAGGDEFVETTLRHAANGAVVLHLINWASGERPSSGAIPLGPLRVSVRLPPGTPRPRSVLLGFKNRKVKFNRRGNAIAFTIPSLAEYEMAIIA